MRADEHSINARSCCWARDSLSVPVSHRVDRHSACAMNPRRKSTRSFGAEIHGTTAAGEIARPDTERAHPR